MVLQIKFGPSILGPSNALQHIHASVMRSPAVFINNQSCLAFEFVTASAFSASVGFTSNGSYEEHLIHRNLAGTTTWNRLQLTVSTNGVDIADKKLFVFVFESSANQTGFGSSIRNIQLSMEACPVFYAGPVSGDYFSL